MIASHQLFTVESRDINEQVIYVHIDRSNNIQTDDIVELIIINNNILLSIHCIFNHACCCLE